MFKVVADPVPVSVVAVYVGARFAGPALVMEHEAVMVVDTLKVPANVSSETAAKKAAPAAAAVMVRVKPLRFKVFETFLNRGSENCRV